MCTLLLESIIFELRRAHGPFGSFQKAISLPKASRKLFLYQKLPESYFFTRKSAQKAISLPKASRTASRNLFLYQKLSKCYFFTKKKSQKAISLAKASRKLFLYHPGKASRKASSDHLPKLIVFMCNLLLKSVIFELRRAHGPFGPLYTRILVHMYNLKVKPQKQH